MILRFEVSKIPVLGSRYAYRKGAPDLFALQPPIQAAGKITKNQLRKIANWKSPRVAGHIEKNTEDYIEEITRFALSTNSERARIESLTILDGVSWPMASVILHFFHKERYPILDFRALWSLSVEERIQYDFELWWEYVQACRSLADSAGTDMRSLDRALWQYSKENAAKPGVVTDGSRSHIGPWDGNAEVD